MVVIVVALAARVVGVADDLTDAEVKASVARHLSESRCRPRQDQTEPPWSRRAV